jgi:hypothetical protein
VKATLQTGIPTYVIAKRDILRISTPDQLTALKHRFKRKVLKTVDREVVNRGMLAHAQSGHVGGPGMRSAGRHLGAGRVGFEGYSGAADPFEAVVERETSGTFPSGSVPQRAREALKVGQEIRAVQEAIREGMHDTNLLSDMVFHWWRPDRGGQPIKRSESGFRQLAEEWLWIRDRIVGAAARGEPSPQYFGREVVECNTPEATAAGFTESEVRKHLSRALVATKMTNIRLRQMTGWGQDTQEIWNKSPFRCWFGDYDVKRHTKVVESMGRLERALLSPKLRISCRICKDERAAAWASLTSQKIYLCPLWVKVSDDEKTQTFIHEAAHVVGIVRIREKRFQGHLCAIWLAQNMPERTLSNADNYGYCALDALSGTSYRLCSQRMSKKECPKAP